MPLLLAGGVCCCAVGFAAGAEAVAGFAGAAVGAGVAVEAAGGGAGAAVAAGAVAAVAVASAVEDFFERLDFFVVEADVSALAAVDLPASAVVADSVEEDFFECELFWAGLAEEDLSASVEGPAVSDFFGLDLDFVDALASKVVASAASDFFE